MDNLTAAERAKFEQERQARMATQDPIEWRGQRLELTEEWLATQPTPEEAVRLDLAGHMRMNYGQTGVRRRLRRKYSWGIPTPDSLEQLALLGPIVEIGAGTGYWAHLLREGRVEVEAFDIDPPDEGDTTNTWHQLSATWTRVEPGDPSQAARFPRHALFLCWTPEGLPVGAQAIAAHAGAGGKIVAVVGEPAGGKTGDATMFALLDRFYDEVARLPIPQWANMNDALTVYQRNGRRFSL